MLPDRLFGQAKYSRLVVQASATSLACGAKVDGEQLNLDILYEAQH
jgi:hypothetical protein